MSSPAQCVGLGPLPEPPEAYSTSLLAPVHIIVDVFAALLVGKAQGLSFLLAQEPRNDTTTFVKTLHFIRGMLGTYPALTVVAIVIALLNLVPGGLMFLWSATSDVEEVLDEEPNGTERCQLAVLRGSMAVILVVLGALLVTSFAANSLYSDNIFRLPEHAHRFRSILTAYKDDVHNTSGCVLQSQSHHIAASLAPAYSSCTQSLMQDVPKHDLQHRADIGKISEYLSALPTAAILADNLELSLLRLRQWQERADPLLFAAVPVKPTAANCDDKKHDFCKKLNSSWISLRDAAKAFSLEPPHVSGVIKKLRSLIEEGRIGTLEAEITQYEVMTSDTAKYLKNDVKKDWQPALEADVYGQSHVQGLRITMVLSRFTEVISWVSNWADPIKTPTLHLASNLSHLNTLHMSALTCAWLLSVLAVGLSFIGERQTGRLLVRLSEALFACFVLQVHVVVSVLLFLGLVGQRAVCEPALEPWSDETKASINQLVAIDARQRWMADMPEVVRRCHLKKSVYQAFKTNTAPGSAEKTGVSAPPELAHALFALEATPALNTSVVFQGLLSNLLSADSMTLLNTILSLQLTSLSTSDMKQVKVHVYKLAEWMGNVSSIAKTAILTMTGTLQENDELLKNELDRRSALLDEAVAVVRGSVPDIDAYTAAEVQINNSKVLAKQAAAAAQLATLYEARQVLTIADSTSCLQMAALRITQDVVVNIREGVRTQIGKCAYLSQAYNLSVHVVCDKIVYSMNTFWAASLLFCVGYLILEVLAQQANKLQLKLEIEEEDEEEAAAVQATTVADVA